MPETTTAENFADLDLPEALMRAVLAVGYEIPTPIQSRTIPPLLQGRDLLGHAPTGTGKTAAFALPILARLEPGQGGVRALVLAPTRELAIQVAEAFAKYATFMKNVRVLPIYGGQDYTGQIRQLGRGVDIVVGTPGRVMDHMRRGTLKLDKLQTLVLDEADEMLRMGFIDDVQWILEQTPPTRQMALFSATMPAVIRRIAARHLTEPVEISIEGRSSSAATIRQRFWLVSGLHKLDALTRILEAETFEAMLVFVRTKTATVELAEKLSARGFAADAMNGDMPQKQREQMVEKLKRGQLDILVATDVVARGLDVDRISHVINYDIPYDTEAYIHRIGRTGRAGRTGDAILFVTQRERRLLSAIEHATRQRIEPLQLPTVEMVNNKRIADFKQRISDNLATGGLAYLQRLVEDFSRDHDVPPERVAAALARMCLGEQPLMLETRESSHTTRPGSDEKRRQKPESRQHDEQRVPDSQKKQREPRGAAASSTTRSASSTAASSTAGHYVSASDTGSEGSSEVTPQPSPAMENSAPAESRSARRRAAEEADLEMERFRVEVGSEHGVKPENLVGAIANEAGLDAAFIGRIKINEDHSLIELPSGMPKFLLKDLKRVWVCNQQLNISRVNAPDAEPSRVPAAHRATATEGAGRTATSRSAPKSTLRSTSKSTARSTSAPTSRAAFGESARPSARASSGTSSKAFPGTVSTTVKREARKKDRHRDRKNKGKPD